MNGLTEKQVIENRKKFGTNEIIFEKREKFWKMLLATLGDPIIKILLIALAIKVIFLFSDFNWYETIGIVIAIFIASFISTISEYGSEKAFDKLQEEALQIKSKVKRNNVVKEIEINNIVVDDLILLESGDKVPADGIIVEGNIIVNEASINGEIKGKEKNKNDKVYRSTIVYEGFAKMKVKKIGCKTLYGTLAKEINEKSPESPLKQRLTQLAKIISKIGYVGAFLVTFSYLFSVIIINNNFDVNKILLTFKNLPLLLGYILHALTLSVTIIVVAVPEGLPMMITLVLSSNMKRMLKNNVLVRKLNGIETAGNINILFTDKTGTITKGNLSVIGFLDTFGNIKNREEIKNSQYDNLVKLSFMANNTSTINNNKIVGGNITDKALLNFFKKEKIKYKIIEKIPFNSTNKYSVAKINYNNKNILLIKGAPEVILNKCAYYYDKNAIKKGLFHLTKIKKNIENYGKKGIRIIALATIIKENKYCLIGFALIKDNVREEAINGLALIQNAGIDVIMITGDNKDTACSIGKEINLVKNDKDIILTSEEFNKMSDSKVKEVLPNLKILSRALPMDKSRLITIARNDGKIVGMTGDGVNDAPALKKADVGFAMGSGTEIAKEASDIIILDNNLYSISNAVLYGRCIFKSIRKFIIFQLTINLCAVSLSIVGPFIGVNTPVTVIQMLWINMVMDTLAGIAFSFEPALKEYMKEKPKKKNESIINRYMRDEIFFTGIFSSLLCILFLKSPQIHYFFRFDINNKYLMTAFFGLFIFTGIFNCFNARTSRINLLANITKNKVFLSVIFFILLVQIYLIYFGGDLFRTYGLTYSELIVIIFLASLVVPVDWIRKIYLRKKGIIGGV